MPWRVIIKITLVLFTKVGHTHTLWPSITTKKLYFKTGIVLAALFVNRQKLELTYKSTSIYNGMDKWMVACLAIECYLARKRNARNKSQLHQYGYILKRVMRIRTKTKEYIHYHTSYIKFGVKYNQTISLGTHI